MILLKSFFKHLLFWSIILLAYNENIYADTVTQKISDNSFDWNWYWYFGFVASVSAVAVISYLCGTSEGKKVAQLYYEGEIEKLRKIKVEEWLYPDRALLDQPFKEEIDER